MGSGCFVCIKLHKYVSVNFLLQGTMFVTDIKEENKSGRKTSRKNNLCASDDDRIAAVIHLNNVIIIGF